MQPEDLLVWLRAIPFQPFSIVLNNGRTYAVPHPRKVRVGRTSVIFFWFSTDEEDAPYERTEMFSPLLIERVEPIDVA